MIEILLLDSKGNETEFLIRVIDLNRLMVIEEALYKSKIDFLLREEGQEHWLNGKAISESIDRLFGKTIKR